MENRLGIPSGSIGPTLGRCARKLRDDPELLAFFPEVAEGDGSAISRTERR